MNPTRLGIRSWFLSVTAGEDLEEPSSAEQTLELVLEQVCPLGTVQDSFAIAGSVQGGPFQWPGTHRAKSTLLQQPLSQNTVKCVANHIAFVYTQKILAISPHFVPLWYSANSTSIAYDHFSLKYLKTHQPHNVQDRRTRLQRLTVFLEGTSPKVSRRRAYPNLLCWTVALHSFPYHSPL